MILGFDDIKQKDLITTEILVIGSGAGGSLTAALLAEAGFEVLLLEAGPFLRLDETKKWSREEMELKYRNGGITPALGRLPVAYIEGKCVGGGTEINSGLYHQTPTEIIEEWRNGWKIDALSTDILAPYFNTIEKDLSVSSLPGTPSALSQVLIDGANSLDWKVLEVPRWFKYSSEKGQKAGEINGIRQSMTETYIPRLIKAGGSILPDCSVKRLKLRGKNVYDADAILKDKNSVKELKIKAKEFFLCAGAIQTPFLLRKSVTKRNIGDNFQLHPTIKLTAQFPYEMNSSEVDVPVHQVKQFAPDLSFGGSISIPGYIAVAMGDNWWQWRQAIKDWQKIGIYYAMIKPTGSGKIRTLPFSHEPFVTFKLTQKDIKNISHGVAYLGKLLFAAGAEKLYPSIRNHTIMTKPKDCYYYLYNPVDTSRANIMSIHLFGSCPMGEDKNICATDSFGKIHDIKNIYVNDSSLLPSAPGVNPQGSIMAIAMRNVKRFINSYR